jgi:hypothetical protein
MKRLNKSQQIRNYLKKNPNANAIKISEALGISNAYVHTVMWKDKQKVTRKAEAQADVNFEVAQNERRLQGWQGQDVEGKFVPVPVGFKGKTLKELDEAWKNAKPKIRMQSTEVREPFILTMEEPKADPVNHPPHYKTGGIETIDFIEAKDLGYHLGNVIKYVSRAKHKGNELEDLKKAQWYLERAIMKLHI